MSKYDEVLQRFEARALPLFDEHDAEVKRQYRLDADSPIGNREDRYLADTHPRFEERWRRAAVDFIGDVQQLEADLEARAYGKPDASHLIGLANVSNDKLPEILAMAQGAGDQTLQQSVIAVARQRGERVLVNDWVKQDPGRSAAAEELNHIPEPERLEAIAKGRKFIPARPDQLAPDREAIQAKASKAAADEAAKASFFDRPRRMVGRHEDRV